MSDSILKPLIKHPRNDLVHQLLLQMNQAVWSQEENLESMLGKAFERAIQIDIIHRQNYFFSGIVSTKISSSIVEVD